MFLNNRTIRNCVFVLSLSGLHAFGAATITTVSQEFCKIIGMSIAAAVLYGTVQDQITARVCIEYFNSDLHPGHKNFLLHMGYQNLEALSPTQIAFFFGFYATWWVGLGLGVPLAFAARTGRNLPKLPLKDLVKPMAVLLSSVAVGSLLSGVIGYALASNGQISLYDNHGFDQDTCNKYLANGCAHNAAYALGIVGGIGMCLWVLRKRINLKQVDQETLVKQLRDLMKELKNEQPETLVY